MAEKNGINTMDEYAYAGFWIRVAAALIDTLLLVIVFSIPLTLIYGVDYWDPERQIQGAGGFLIQYVAPIVITVWFWIRYLGTPGKMALRLRILDARTGKAISTPKAIGRYLGYYVSALPLLLGFIWVGIDKKKQGFHDKLAGTVVVRDRAQEAGRFE